MPQSKFYAVHRWLPFVMLVIALAVQIFIPDSPRQPAAAHPYFTYLLTIIIILYLALCVTAARRVKLAGKLAYKSWFYCGAALFLTALNLMTSKLAILPVLYFPSLDRVTGVLYEDRALLLKCLLYSARLLAFGVIGGMVTGLATGLLVGFSRCASYWISPIVRLIGPIPTTVWIPLALIVFPSAITASAFLVGLAVWFPVTLMTSSGIANVPRSYFEAGATLGAGRFTCVFKIGAPAAMPHIFLGLFNGSCASFITLVTAELIGARYGIGWYINWQKDMLSYSNVYAGLIVIALSFFLLVTGLFKARDRVLGWQKGVIRW